MEVDHLKREIKAMGAEREESDGRFDVALGERSKQIEELEGEKLRLSKTVEVVLS